MKRKNKTIRLGLVITGFLILIGFPVFPVKFFFKYNQDQKYRIISTIYQEVYINDELVYSADTLDKISVTVLETIEDKGLLSMIFQVSEKLSEGTHIFKMHDETLQSQFWRSREGKFSLAEKNIMPVVRNVPLFPDKELKAGDTWSAYGEECHDFRDWGMAYPVCNTMEVNYIYLRDDVFNGSQVAVFKIYYISEWNSEKYRKYTSGAPVKIIGFSDQLLYWNTAKGRQEGYEDRFNVRYFYANGNVQQFKGAVKGEVREALQMDKEKIAAELNLQIKKAEIPDVRVEKNSEGVVLTLENIQFEPESDLLLPGEKEKLKKLAALLKVYPDRELLISGHTALAGTEAGRLLLSEKRAKAVAEFLLSLGTRKADQITYKGLGAKVPLADNSTEAGMRKNRRVEITILEN